MIRVLLLLALVFFTQESVFAEIPGTARSNERDILRLDTAVGLATPAPGVGFGVSVLRTFRPAHAYGLAINILHHGPTHDYERINSQAYDFIWEYSLALLEGFHALRLRAGLGVSNSYFQKDTEALGHKAGGGRSHAWYGHALGSAAFDLPIADLMWLRLGAQSQRAFSKEAPLQSEFFVGIVFGGQWIGIGD